MPLGKQIEFPPEQTHVRWLTPFMFLLSGVCILVVVLLLVTDVEGAFIGPW
jgi:hypothetical protein